MLAYQGRGRTIFLVLLENRGGSSHLKELFIIGNHGQGHALTLIAPLECNWDSPMNDGLFFSIG
jgi:hypothetical protein